MTNYQRVNKYFTVVQKCILYSEGKKDTNSHYFSGSLNRFSYVQCTYSRLYTNKTYFASDYPPSSLMR
jgi:hypothetical protein